MSKWPTVTAPQELRPLTGQQQMFCREYVATTDLNGTTAAIRAGYKKSNARFHASRLLTKANVKEEIRRLMEKRNKRVDVTADMVVQRLYRLGFYDVRKFYDGQGRLVPINQLDDDTAPAVIGINVTPGRRKKGRQVSAGSVKSIRLANPKDSLELLGRHLGMFKDVLKVEHDEFEGKTPEELRYYAEHGKWPDKPAGSGGITPEGAGQETGG